MQDDQKCFFMQKKIFIQTITCIFKQIGQWQVQNPLVSLSHNLYLAHVGRLTQITQFTET